MATAKPTSGGRTLKIPIPKKMLLDMLRGQLDIDGDGDVDLADLIALVLEIIRGGENED
jgi:hypothetical protein